MTKEFEYLVHLIHAQTRFALFQISDKSQSYTCFRSQLGLR